MYSLQLRRGIARGRIWHTSAICQTSRSVGDDVVSDAHYVQPARSFHGSRQLDEDAKGNCGDGNTPREIPKMNFADLMKKATGLRQAMFKRPPPDEAPVSASPQQSTAAPSQADRVASGSLSHSVGQSPPQPPPHHSPYDTSHYTQRSQTPAPLPTSYQPPRATNGPPRIRQQLTTAPPEEVTNLMARSAQSSQAGESTARINRINRMRARIRRYDSEPKTAPLDQQGGRTDSQVDRAQERAYAQAERATRAATDSRMLARSFTPAGAASGPSSFSSPNIKFGSGRDPKGSTSLRMNTRGGARGRGGSGMRGRGGGGGRGGAAARKDKRGGKASASARALELKEEEEMEKEWLQITSKPHTQTPGEIEPHPIYDSTRPYFADTANLSKWIPAIGGNASVGASKLGYVGKPKHEPMLKWTSRALCGDGIVVPGEQFVADITQLQVQKGGRAHMALSKAEEGLMKNPSFKDKHQQKFLDVVRGKLGVVPQETRA
ncbi:hypothetical protein H072_5103 [Dactylellina haptotyla CBS 200.50]|uniref:Uncharacterized protein n=1 Tax=Dactylellina haptotyla (strain CBS 200.50) TaxID=1284197 RepID=S8C088_DACHA|nr:hypothetical protein H072_5103 [Dactylellina haptotyla CBS 200.50]